MYKDILRNGIYFQQEDMIEDGYYIQNKDGEYIKRKYEEPSILKKIKHFLYYGYPLKIETKSTSFFFFKYDDDIVYKGFHAGDAISVAKKIKKSLIGVTQEKYTISEAYKIIINSKDFVIELTPKDNGQKLECISFQISKNKYVARTIYTFLNWDNL